MEMAARGIDDEWRDAFVLEARLLDLTGDQIGDALAVIEGHVAESGEGARDSFGDPVRYARDLANEAPQRTVGRGGLTARDVVGGLAGLLGLLLVAPATEAVLSRESIEITLGSVLVGAFAVLLMAGFLWRSTPVLRWLTRASLLAIAVGSIVVVAVMAAVILLAPQPIVRLTWPAALGTCLVLVLGGTWALWPTGDGDPVRDPRTGGSDATPVLKWVSGLALPGSAFVIVAMTWTLHAAT